MGSQGVSDDARAHGGIEHEELGDLVCGKKKGTRANQEARQVRRAVALTAEPAAQSDKEVSAVCSHPLGLQAESAAEHKRQATSHKQSLLCQEESLSSQPRLRTMTSRRTSTVSYARRGSQVQKRRSDATTSRQARTEFRSGRSSLT